MRNAADSRKGLAPEAQSADGLQPALVRELARGVPEEGYPGVLGGHTTAVVRDSYIFRAAAAYFDGDVPGAGVHRIFQKLLHGGGGPFHDLAGGYEIRHEGREYINFGHVAPLFRLTIIM